MTDENIVLLLSLLLSGDLLGFEYRLRDIVNTLYDLVATELLREGSLATEAEQKALARGSRMGRLRPRSCKVQLLTGSWVEVTSLYAEKVPEGHEGSRYPLHLWWGIEKRATPGCLFQAARFAVMSPSFDMAAESLMAVGVKAEASRCGELAEHFGRRCAGIGTARLGVTGADSLAGRNVAVSLDGGRTRCREVVEGRPGYSTPWREPKMFVVAVLDEEGKASPDFRPVYGFGFSDEEVVERLREQLSVLDIQDAASVQLLADGAPWIWKRVPPMLKGLGVPERALEQTLDYYHASGYLTKIAEKLPKSERGNAKYHVGRWKERLWAGDARGMLEEVARCFKKRPKEVVTYMGYFKKNSERMNYGWCRDNGKACGSGIIESAIRRVINLRFKCPSAFWKKENLPGLYFLRGIALAKRWNILTANYLSQNQKTMLFA